jgi:hypothetical protein
LLQTLRGAKRWLRRVVVVVVSQCIGPARVGRSTAPRTRGLQGSTALSITAPTTGRIGRSCSRPTELSPGRRCPPILHTPPSPFLRSFTVRVLERRGPKAPPSDCRHRRADGGGVSRRTVGLASAPRVGRKADLLTCLRWRRRLLHGERFVGTGRSRITRGLWGELPDRSVTHGEQVPDGR